MNKSVSSHLYTTICIQPMSLPDTDGPTANLDSGDPANGHELRLEAYRRAWTECLERIQVRFSRMRL